MGRQHVEYEQIYAPICFGGVYKAQEIMHNAIGHTTPLTTPLPYLQTRPYIQDMTNKPMV